MKVEPVRRRREPPKFRRAAVRNVNSLSPHLVQVTVAGPELDDFVVEQPAASVRLLVPSPDGEGLVIPTWNGNEFLLPDGRRPTIRTLTPGVTSRGGELSLAIVVHGRGAA